MFSVDDLDLPLIAAPMAGAPSTPALVRAAASAGALGFLAGGYKTARDLEAQLAQVRDLTSFGVNLFVPNPVPVDPAAYRRFAAIVRREAARYAVEVPDDPREDDDDWGDKLALLLDDPVPFVSLTFGSPGPEVVRSLKGAGSVVIQTVTSAHEAAIAVESGVDALAVQAIAAGAHSGTFTPGQFPVNVPLLELLTEVRAVTRLPLVAAGGLATSDHVAGVMAAGAAAAMVGTALLRSDESGASETYKAALADPARTETIRTRAFTGRPARGLRNAFLDAHDAEAVEGYPAIHYLTSPMRKAAAAAGDPERINLWAGTGWRHARPGLAAGILSDLAGKL